jgi:hypothetical protein
MQPALQVDLPTAKLEIKIVFPSRSAPELCVAGTAA